MFDEESGGEELERLRRRNAELERKVAEHEERWQSIVRNAPDVFLELDRQGAIQYISRPERDVREVLGASGFDFLVPEHREMARQAVREVFETGRPLTREVQELEQGRWYAVRFAALERDGEINSIVVICTDISERKRQEDDLRANEARLRSMLKQLPVIVFTTDRELRFISSNGTGLERLGLKPDEVVGRTAYEYFGTEDPTFRPIAAMLSALEGRPDEYETEWEGNIYHAMSEPLRDSQGRIEGTLGVALDITERRHMEQALRDSEERFRQMAESIREVFYLADPNQQRLLYVSPAYEDIWRQPREQAFNDVRAWTDSIHPDDRAAVVANLEELFQGRGKTVTQFRIIRPDGTIRWIEDRTFMIHDEAGRLHRLSGICTDITERKRAEDDLLTAHEETKRLVAERTRELRHANRQLREEKSRFRVLADESPIPVVISKPEDGEILYCNTRVEELLGMPKDSLLGRRVTEFYDDASDREKLLETFRRDGVVHDREVRIRRADGRRLWVSISLRGIIYDGGQQLYGGLVDITKIKDTEESLRGERRLLKRLLDLHERDRQLVAYEIHDGMVQHMTGTAMYVERAHDDLQNQPDEQQKLSHALKLLRGSIDEARRLINGLRPPILEEEGLVAAIENLIEEMRATAALEVELKHEIQFDRIAPALEMAIYRAVQESLNNVWQHSESSRARVEFIQRGEEVRLVIEDWGCGFDPSQVGKKRYGLLGVRERAKLLGGRARISSSKGKGTRIDVMLPLTDVLLPFRPDETEVK